MKTFDRYKYATYTDKEGRKVVIAISHHAGKVVRGVAKCHPEDNFDIEKGKAIASARCNAKVCAKRLVDAQDRMEQAKSLLDQAQNYYLMAKDKYWDCVSDMVEAEAHLESLLEKERLK